jgi:hypothetical protein
MDFVRNDDVILRLDSKTKDADKLAFSLRVTIRVTSGTGGDAKAAKVSALHLIKTRRLHAPSKAQDDVRDDATKNPGGGGQGGGGAEDDQFLDQTKESTR